MTAPRLEIRQHQTATLRSGHGLQDSRSTTALRRWSASACMPTPATTTTYVYQSPKDPSSTIRLFTFVDQRRQSGSTEATSSGLPTLSLRTFSLNDAPPYTALSYTWGSNVAQTPVSVEDRCLYIQASCSYALGQLYSSGLCSWYWIDALCINQDDPLEKAEQVQMMAAIFCNAKQVAMSLLNMSPKAQILVSALAEILPHFRMHPRIYFEQAHGSAIEIVSTGFCSLRCSSPWKEREHQR